MQYGIISYSHHAVHYIPMTYLFYNWKFMLFNSFQLFCPLPLATSNLFSVSMNFRVGVIPHMRVIIRYLRLSLESNVLAVIVGLGNKFYFIFW